MICLMRNELFYPPETIESLLLERFGGDLHKKQIQSLSNATEGVIGGASLAIGVIGQSLAQAQGLSPKHAIKQVDRLVGTMKFKPWDLFSRHVPKTVGDRKQIVVAMDWTDFDHDDQSTIALHLIEKHGKSQPLIWLSVWKYELKDQRNDFEDACLQRLKECLPPDVAVTVLADRGFGDRKLFHYLKEELGFDYVIRFKGNIAVTSQTGESKPAQEWLSGRKRGQTVKLKHAAVTAKAEKVGSVVCVHDKGMEDPWYLATSLADETARQIITLYASRWSIETSFRDTKDIRFGMGLSAVHVSEPERRDMMLLLNALAIHFLLFLGIASEKTGMDRRLKSSSTTKRTHSLFRQGCMIYDLMPTMREEWLRPIIEEFSKLIKGAGYITCIFENLE
jgi:hypothetical protein